MRMPNVKVLAEDHKRLTQLKGELTAKQGKVVYYQDVEKFLLDFYEQKKKEVEIQLKQARNDNEREPSSRTKGYIDALEWVLGIDKC